MVAQIQGMGGKLRRGRVQVHLFKIAPQEIMKKKTFLEESFLNSYLNKAEPGGSDENNQNTFSSDDENNQNTWGIGVADNQNPGGSNYVDDVYDGGFGQDIFRSY
ncbi:hypothetical protein V9T40_006789 [Parthenolecanium corni]|uniref:Uncharacterized protein n=1 Tax=Parthenolecanium corni TaxID=536013 RepID=A0AAN9TU68_9HEMI